MSNLFRFRGNHPSPDDAPLGLLTIYAPKVGPDEPGYLVAGRTSDGKRVLYQRELTAVSKALHDLYERDVKVIRRRDNNKGEPQFDLAIIGKLKTTDYGLITVQFTSRAVLGIIAGKERYLQEEVIIELA